MFNSPYMLLALATLFWGGNFTLGKAVSGSIPPLTLSYLRWVEALLIFLPFCWAELKTHKEQILKNWQIFTVLGLTGIMGFNMCVYLAVRYTTAINAALINSFSPIVITLFSLVFIREKLLVKYFGGILISFLGVVWIISGGQWQKLWGLSFNKGDLIMLLAVFFWGIYSTVLKKKGEIVPQKTLFAASIIAGLVFTLPLLIYESTSGFEWIKHLSAFHYLSLLYFGIFPTILSFLFFNKALLKIGPSRSSVYLNLVMVFATVFSILFLGEKLIAAHIIGGGLIILGVISLGGKSTEEVKLISKG